MSEESRGEKNIPFPLCKPLDHKWIFLDLPQLLSWAKSCKTKRACWLPPERTSSGESHPCWVPSSSASDMPLTLPCSAPTPFHPSCGLTDIGGAPTSALLHKGSFLQSMVATQKHAALYTPERHFAMSTATEPHTWVAIQPNRTGPNFSDVYES